MSVKTQLLTLLEENQNTYLSGQTLADALAISRSAVWKAVSSLRDDGFEISAATNRGYRLINNGGCEKLSAAAIESLLRSRGGFAVETYKTVPSTNTLARERAAAGAAEGLIIAADEQSAGRGRFGRSFISPSGAGVYFSLLLRPNIQPDSASLITSAAAVAVARAAERVTGAEAGIKWVNDLYTGGKKFCGILTEASMDMESGLIGSAVLGIGINLTPPSSGYPPELCGIIGSLFDNGGAGKNAGNRLIAETVLEFWPFYKNLAAKEFLEEYRARSIVVGREVIVLSSGNERPALALSIDDECRLTVRYENGEIQVLNSGEVSIRPINS